MSEHQLYLQEKEKIDALLEKGYRIVEVTENLSGAFVQFEWPDGTKGTNKREQLHILTPDARKYFSNLIVKQQRGA